MNEPVKKFNILDNIDRSSVCLTAVVIFARLRGGELRNFADNNKLEFFLNF